MDGLGRESGRGQGIEPEECCQGMNSFGGGAASATVDRTRRLRYRGVTGDLLGQNAKRMPTWIWRAGPAAVMVPKSDAPNVPWGGERLV